MTATDERTVMRFSDDMTTFVRVAPDGVETIWVDDKDDSEGPRPLAFEPPATSHSTLQSAYQALRMLFAPSEEEIEDIARRMRRQQRADDWRSDEINEATRRVYRRDAVTALHAQAEIILGSRS